MVEGFSLTGFPDAQDHSCPKEFEKLAQAAGAETAGAEAAVSVEAGCPELFEHLAQVAVLASSSIVVSLCLRI